MPKRDPNKLTAAEIMQADVVVVDQNDTLGDALTMITENHITGLPVLGSGGRCVGIVSATDILSYEQEHSEFTAEANEDLARYFDPEQQRWESVRLSAFALEEFAEIPVGEIMSHDPIAVGPGTSIGSVAATMVEKKVHRILVLDEERQLCGIISATDFVRIMAE